MLERFTQEKQRRHKNNSTFDLEDEEEERLTHMGQSLSLDGPKIADDFVEEDINLSDVNDHQTENEGPTCKRRRSSQIANSAEENIRLREDDNGNARTRNHERSNCEV